MDTSRRLALRMHALHEEDRSWLLAQLEDAPRQQLITLLEEVREIGLIPDAELLMTAADEAQDRSMSSDEATIRIGMASPLTVCRALRNEPSSVRRYLSQARPWPWLRHLDQEQLAFLQGREDEAKLLSLPPKAQHALLQAFAAQLADTELPPHHIDNVARPSLFSRIRKAGRWPR